MKWKTAKDTKNAKFLLLQTKKGKVSPLTTFVEGDKYGFDADLPDGKYYCDDETFEGFFLLEIRNGQGEIFFFHEKKKAKEAYQQWLDGWEIPMPKSACGGRYVCNVQAVEHKRGKELWVKNITGMYEETSTNCGTRQFGN